MNRLNTVRDVALTVVGWIALLLYILACRPSWSPDGSKLLVPYYDPETDEAGVALLDRTTSDMRSVYIRVSSSDRLIPVQWEDAGEHAIVWIEERMLLFLPIDSSDPARTLRLPKGVEWSGPPTPQVGGSLYFGGDAVFKLDLADGKITSHETEREFILYEAGERVLYLAETEDGLELGEIDQKKLVFEPFFHLANDDLESLGIDEVPVYYAAFEPGGRRIALTGHSEHGGRILLCTESGLERVLAPRFPMDDVVFGNIEWSPTHDRIYATALSPTNKEDVTLLSVAEVAVDGTTARLIPLAQIEGSLTEDDSVVGTIALSPDGSRIAASTTHNDGRSFLTANRAVFLVDLEDPERVVTKFPLFSLER